MSYIPTTDEDVAEDFKRALEDLQINNRFEISNLTVIARENTEHALAISETLKTHIRQAPPHKKLPALYVLDSIVKNAYALVDNNVRRKMDETLKTWKDPVPGGMDTRPVFPPEITRPIENALIKARTSAVQAEQARNQQMGRGRPMMTQPPYRETATPPMIPPQGYNGPPTYTAGYNNYQQYSQPMNGQPYTNGQQLPPAQQYSNGAQINGYNYTQSQYGPTQQLSNQYPPQPDVSLWQQQQQPSQYPVYRASEPSIDTLNSDLAHLINESKQAFAQNPLDSNIQQRLKALLDLQTILQRQTVAPDQIDLIRSQVAQLSKAAQQPRASLPVHVPSPAPVATPPIPAVQQLSLDTLLGPGALAALRARQSITPQVPTPPMQNAVPIRSPVTKSLQESQYNPPPATTASVPTPGTNSLLERLRAAGMLPGTPAGSSTPTLASGFPTALAVNNPLNISRTPLAHIPNYVVLKPASLKMPRPHLISTLYEKLGTPCTQCGRRFQSDEAGKKKRDAHMDWHFRTHQRMIEAERKGQHRSWYVDELDWIQTRESLDLDPSSSITNGDSTLSPSSAAAKIKPKLQYVPAPNDPAKVNSVCPICQEKFETMWLDEAQEFVWMDAKEVGGRIWHANCWAEARVDGGGKGVEKQIGKVEADSVLGKRKAEDGYSPSATKIKVEP